MELFLNLWRWFSPVNRWLFLFALLNTGVDIVLLKTAGYPVLVTLSYTKGFLGGVAYDDSWTPMTNALAYTDHPGPAPLYQEIFFKRRVKFQYPPTSLLFLDALRRAGGPALVSKRSLNHLSWYVVWATVAFNVMLYLRGLRETDRVQRVIGGALIACFTLTFYPVLRSFCLGQIQTWITFLVALLLWLWMSDRKIPAGVAAGLIAMIKPQLGLLLLWGLLRREWKFAGAWAATFGVGLLLSIAAYGWASHVDYLRVLSYMSRHGEVYFPNQSVNGLLNRLLGNGDSMKWEFHAFASYNRWVYAGTLASSLILIVGALMRGRGDVPDLMLAVLSFTMASPIAWEHHYGVMMSIFAIALPLTLGSTWGIALLAVSFYLSAHFFQDINRYSGTPWNFLQSYLFFGAVLLLVQLYRLRGVGVHASACSFPDTPKRKLQH